MIRNLKKADGDFQYFLSDHEDPLLEYVNIVAEKYRPATNEDLRTGLEMPAQGYFLTRYFENKVEKDFRKQYFDDTDMQNTIVKMGYDIEKFWYLFLFINDFTNGLCEEGLELEDTALIQVKDFLNRIYNNIESIDSKDNNPDSFTNFRKPMKIILETSGEKQKNHFILDDPNAVSFLAIACTQCLKEDFGVKLLEKQIQYFKKEDGELKTNKISKSIQACYFANMFLAFFELMPPKKLIRKKNPDYYYNTESIIASLILIVDLTDNEVFSDKSLKGLLSQNKNLDFSRMINRFYL